MQLVPYIKLMRFDRPIGIMLLLWPTLTALLLTHADVRTTIIFVLGAIIMRAAGCVINDYADRNFDSYVDRTKSRPLATQQISSRQAVSLFALLITVAFGLALQLQMYTILLSGVALILAMSYPFMKRFFNYPQLILGIAFAWSILMVYAEVWHSVPIQAWTLFAATVAWVIAYDTQYAMADKKDDLVIGIKSTAITFGDYDKMLILVLQVLALAMYLLLGANGWFVLAALAFVLYQQYLLIDRDPRNCMRAFLNNNYFGACIFLAFLC